MGIHSDDEVSYLNVKWTSYFSNSARQQWDSPNFHWRREVSIDICNSVGRWSLRRRSLPSRILHIEPTGLRHHCYSRWVRWQVVQMLSWASGVYVKWLLPDISHPTTVETSRYDEIRGNERTKQYVISEHVNDQVNRNFLDWYVNLNEMNAFLQEIAGRLMLVTKTHHMETDSILEFKSSILPFTLDPFTHEPLVSVSLFKHNFTFSPVVIGKKPKVAEKVSGIYCL